MITRKSHGLQCHVPETPGWREEMASALRSHDTVNSTLGLQTGSPKTVRDQFALRIPATVMQRIETGNPRDPLLRQFLPSADEAVSRPLFGTDPLDEAQHLLSPGLLHKYPGRALLIVTGACPVHCRYCFRRHFPYTDENPAREHWQAALQALRNDRSIGEIILSGGDPLSLTDTRLKDLVTQLAAIPHLHTLRVHTRFPVVIPARIGAGLLSWLTGTRLNPVVVLHVNHAREIDDTVREALTRLKQAGVTLLNQSVLLKGVNDSATTLIALSETLFAAGVLPYYLHMLDRVQGTAHFEVAEPAARLLIERMRQRLPGYLVPRLVREIPGRPSKTPV